jgi:hypothetical protein
MVIIAPHVTIAALESDAKHSTVADNKPTASQWRFTSVRLLQYIKIAAVSSP